MNYMDADSVSHLLHCSQLINDFDYKVITTAPNDSKMNTVILQYLRAMDRTTLIKFADLLRNIETYQSVGDNLKLGTYVNIHIIVILKEVLIHVICMHL